MLSMFETSIGLDAHMILNLLQQYGISGRIEGEYLQGGVGELQAMGFVRVLVSEDDYANARKIIDEWESIQQADEKKDRQVGASNSGWFFIAGVVAGGTIVYWLLR